MAADKASSREILPVVVGTAGHIDHGKSSLVRVLTGIDPDRLAEEKRRGLTIDLGFARLQLPDGRWLGFVDVPGHERFVRNMVAGATGIDLALLVVAADDGVMPQTQEHVEILELLGVRSAIVALNKIDMVDPGLAALAASEIRELLRPTHLALAPILPVSAATGVGLEALRSELARCAAAVAQRDARGPFRMPIQRVFSLPGIGTVVTGIPQSGTIAPGDTVAFLPLGAACEVRGLHAYGGKVASARAGHSTALAVPGARDWPLHRGMVVATPDTCHAGSALDVSLTAVARGRPLPHRAAVRCHVGTAEVQGELVLLDRELLQPGAQCTARLELAEPVACAPDDRFLLRLQTPPRTVGGGTVLRVADTARIRRQQLAVELDALAAAGASPAARLRLELERCGPAGAGLEDLARALVLPEAAVLELLPELPDAVYDAELLRVFLAAHVQVGAEELQTAVAKILQHRPDAASVARSAVRTSRTLPEPLLAHLFARLIASGRARPGRRGHLLFEERLRPLPPERQELLQRIVARCAEAGARPPDRAELAQALGVAVDADLLGSLLERAQDEGRLVAVGEHWYASGPFRQLLLAIRDNCQSHGGVLDIPALRDGLGTSRKYLIPLLEHVDAMGLTVLRGGVRRLLPSSAACRELDRPEPGAPVD
ncbi:MAG: selenocysteine-specific translation elongation factor [Planctomycetes bacterium]|nr:selenocysteine-specific translation elongation factor [Planctomycetota bacterium]